MALCGCYTADAIANAPSTIHSSISIQVNEWRWLSSTNIMHYVPLFFSSIFFFFSLSWWYKNRRKSNTRSYVMAVCSHLYTDGGYGASRQWNADHIVRRNERKTTWLNVCNDEIYPLVQLIFFCIAICTTTIWHHVNRGTSNVFIIIIINIIGTEYRANICEPAGLLAWHIANEQPVVEMWIAHIMQPKWVRLIGSPLLLAHLHMCSARHTCQ